MNKAGYQAEAVIMGTRNYGYTPVMNPDFTNFNHIIALVTEKKTDRQILLDATSGIPGGELSVKSLNGAGWVISSSNPRRVIIGEKLKSKLHVESVWTCGEDNLAQGDFTLRGNHLASHLLSDEKSYNPKDLEEIFNSRANFKIKDYDYKIAKGMSTRTFNASVTNEGGGDFIYFTPVILGNIDYSIFQSEFRSTPLEFPYPVSVTNVVKVKKPAGYVLESAPESKRIFLPSKDMKYSYIVTDTETEVVIQVRMSITKLFYLSTEYADVRAFFNTLSESLNEKIIFKRSQ